MSRRGALVAVLVALTALLVLALALPPLPGPVTGRVLVSLGEDHGIHVSDLPLAVCWLVGVAACVRLWRS